MTIAEIQKVLETSFKNGFYLRRPFFPEYEIYINKAGETWHCTEGLVIKTDLMEFEFSVKDWEIVT